MIDVPVIEGYRPGCGIATSRFFTFYRTIREDNMLPVLLRIPVKGSDRKRTLEMLERDFFLTGDLSVQGALPVMSIERSADSVVAVMEDYGWIPLLSMIDGDLDLRHVSAEMARTLALVHSSGIIHRNLHSSSFMFLEGEKLTCSIAGFEHSVRISVTAKSEKAVPHAELELGTASPETLGLIPFQPDFRSDLYSLGIIFYEMFTGVKPFICHDENDLIYAHIARDPVPPSAVSGEISSRISEIIMKLLMKDPDSRYQSATALLNDLESCQDMHARPYAGGNFQSEVIRPLFTNRVYGRGKEMRKCVGIFESAAKGRARIILAGGPPGAGKTSFVMQFMSGIARQGGLHGRSKDNRHGSNIPYSGIAKAFGQVIRQILTLSDAEISTWREKFTEALGPNLSVITEVIPEFEIITGPQPVQPYVGDIEARNRFIISFRNFVRTLALESGQLVIFLDDIQWSDKAGLDLVSSLVPDPDLKHILLICAYRNNEIMEVDNLSSFLDEMKKNSESADFINIGGLPMEAALEMTEDIIQICRGACPELCDYIFRKTAGNPYYIREYIKTLFSEGLLKIFPDGSPEYDLAGMDRLPATDSLASVLNSAMVTLDQEMKNVLAAGACAGWAFSPYFVAAILRVPVFSVKMTLDNLEKEGYIVRDNDNYRFVHDRVRETAYELNPEQERLKLHRRSGRLLIGMADDDAGIFHAVEQMNLAIGIISDVKERTALAVMNLEAGIMSQNKAAFAPALCYLRTARDLLPEDSWDNEYELTVDILRELARCESVNGNISETESIIHVALGNLHTALEKAEFLDILILQMNITGKFRDAMELALHALSLLGFEIPVDDIDNEIATEMGYLDDFLDRNGINSLAELGRNTDRRDIFVIRIFLRMGWSSYFLEQRIMIYVTLKMMNLVINYGLSRETISACCCYIGVAASIFKDYNTAYSLWKTTELIMEKLDDRYYSAELCLKVANYVIPMIRHLRESEPVNLMGYNAGYMSGEHLCSGYIIAHKVVNAFHFGRELGFILSEINDEIHFNLRIHNFLASDVILSLQRIVLYLTGSHENISGEDNRDESDDPAVVYARISDNNVIFSQVSTFDLQAFFLMGEYSRCLDIIHSVMDKLDAMDGIFTATEFNFYHSLTLVSLIPDADEITVELYRMGIAQNQQVMKKWADRCPENFLHKYLLVEAEMAGFDGRISDAMNLYDRAIASAKENRYLQNEALCNELAARFWFSHGKEEFADIYLRKARSLYTDWGALRKVSMIDRNYPMHIRLRSRSGDHDSDDLAVISRESAAVVRSLQAISGEIEIDRLLHTLTRNILQFGGATRLVFMMEMNGVICVEAEGSLNRPDGEIRSELLHSVPVETFSGVPLGVIRYCLRTGNPVIINDGTADEMFHDDPYIVMSMPKSYICVKNNYGDTSVLAYLENSLTRYAFTESIVEVLKLISVQAAISLENARLYGEKKESIKKLAELGEVRDMLLKQYNEAQQRAMQKRMDPHFLYNAFHTIHSLINVNPAEADRAVLLLGEMLHFFTDRSFEQLVPFNDEWRFTQFYLEFEKIRFPDTLWFFLKKNNSFEDVIIPPMTIQPLVENAIKHGLRKKAGGGIVNISAVRENEFVIIEVLDTGMGLYSDDLYSRSIGNILNRLRYNFNFADVSLTNHEQGGVKATVKFSVRDTE